MARQYNKMKGIGLNIIILFSLSSHQNMYWRLSSREKKEGRLRLTARATNRIATFI
jgi:hypothetical protein